VVLPYAHLFRALNMHILTRKPFDGQLAHDAALLYEALGRGHGFVAYDGIGCARGFRFQARSGTVEATIGEDISPDGEVAFEVETPLECDILLRCNGKAVAQARGTALTFRSDVAGVYRVEAYRRRWLKRRGWIFSNPIYVRPS
jgi:hypothetical protein